MNKKLTKIFCIILCCIFSFGAFAGCSDSSDEDKDKGPAPTPIPEPEHIISQITLSGYKFDENDTRLDDFIKEFNLDYPGVEVTVQHDDVSAEAYFNSLDDRLSSDVDAEGVETEPTIGSVFLIDNERMAKYAAEGKLIPLDKYIGELLNYDTYEKINPAMDLLPAAYDAGIYGDHLYMAGIEYYHDFVFLNYSLIEKAGEGFPADDWSWDDLIAIAEKVKAVDSSITPIAMDYNDYAIWGAFARSYGADIYEHIGDENTEKTLNLTDPDVIRGLEDLAELVDPANGLVECVDASKLSAEELSKYAFVIADHEDVSVWSEYLTSEECAFAWDYVHFPRWNDDAKLDEAGKSLYYQSIGTTVYGFAVYNYGESEEYNEEYYKACATLALYAMVSDATVNYTGEGESVPANKVTNAMKFWREYPVDGKNSSVFSHFAENADFADNLSSFMPVTSEKEINVGAAIDAYINDGIPFTDSLQKIQDLANAGWI